VPTSRADNVRVQVREVDGADAVTVRRSDDGQGDA
jgi:pyrimidine operon attenuation protein/uracil phosphoribosyltransferase